MMYPMPMTVPGMAYIRVAEKSSAPRPGKRWRATSQAMMMPITPPTTPDPMETIRELRSWGTAVARPVRGRAVGGEGEAGKEHGQAEERELEHPRKLADASGARPAGHGDIRTAAGNPVLQ